MNYLKYLALFFTLLVPIDAMAKGGAAGGGRGGFSSSSSRSSSSSSSSKSSFSGKSSSSASKTTTVTPPKKTSFDIAQQRRAIAPPKPKAEYVKEFETKNAAKYPTTFDSKPATRPSYIREKTIYGGRERNIEYNPATRSYGFFDDFGKFMVYSAAYDIGSDAFKDEEKVYVEKTSALDKEAALVKKEEEGMSGWLIAIFVILGLGVVAFGIYILTV